MSYTYDHPRPSVTVDCIVIKYTDKKTEVLLIKRGHPPFKDHWALPGGFLDMDETPEAGALRELQEETGLEAKEISQVGAFGEPDRDPRGRVISLSFLVFLKTENGNTIQAASDASEVKWFPLHELPTPLAFDHLHIIETTKTYMRSQLKLSMIEQVPFYGLSMEDMQEINTLLTEK